MSGIYKIYCITEDKYYIGQSIDVLNRLEQHKRELIKGEHINSKLQNAFNSYGENNFVFEKIKNVEEQFLNVMEGYFIDFYDSVNNGYNMQNINTRVRPHDKHKLEYEKKINRLMALNCLTIEYPIIDAMFIYRYNSLYWDMHNPNYSTSLKMCKFLDANLKQIYDAIYPIYNDLINKIISVIDQEVGLSNGLDIDMNDKYNLCEEDNALYITIDIYCPKDYRNINSPSIIIEDVKIKIVDSESK